MATLTKQIPDIVDGTVITYAAVTLAGDKYFNTGKEMIHVVNADASGTDITFESQTLCTQGSTHDLTITVGAGEARLIGPFSTARWNDADGYVNFSYTNDTDITIAVIAST